MNARSHQPDSSGISQLPVHRRPGLAVLVLILALAECSAGAQDQGARAAAPSLPNVVLILADDKY